MQDFDAGRRGQHLAESVHPVARFRPGADAAMAELIELLELLQLDLELQCRTVAMAAGQRHQQPGSEAIAASRLDLAADKVDRALPIDRQQIIGKTRQVHRPNSSQPDSMATNGRRLSGVNAPLARSAASKAGSD